MGWRVTDPAVAVEHDKDRLAGAIERLSQDDAKRLSLAPDIQRRKPRDNKEKRKLAWQETFENSDGAGLTVFADAVRTVSSYIGRIKTAPERILTAFELRSLMIEQLAITTVRDSLEARHEQIRGIVFAAITKRLTAQGAKDPMNTNGEIHVPELGKRFVREGCGYNDSVVDWDYLKGALEPDELSQFITTTTVPEQVIPEHTVEQYDREALADFLENNPTKLPIIMAATKKGQPKSAKYQVRDIQDDADGYTP